MQSWQDRRRMASGNPAEGIIALLNGMMVRPSEQFCSGKRGGAVTVDTGQG